MPIIQPEYFRARGSVSSPTPTRTLTELKMVCGRVDWPTTTLIMWPSSSICLTSKGSRSCSGSVTPFSCWSVKSRPAWRIDESLTRADRLPYPVP
jgi:hypothetical protein